MLGTLFFMSVACASATTAYAANEDLVQFSDKKFQVTVIKNPNDMLRTGFLGLNKTKDELVVVRLDGKIIKTYVTSSARAGKETPEKIFNRIDRANEDHTSNLYGSEMDWALFLDEDIAIHSTTEDHYKELGKPASAGCLRLLRKDAKELFQIVTGQIAAPGAPVTNYMAKDQIGVNILESAKIKEYWKELPQTEKNLILKMAKESRKQVNKSVKTFKKNGDIADDAHEKTIQEPARKPAQVPARHSR